MLLSAGGAKAQLGFGGEVGLNCSNYMVKKSGTEVETKNRFGMRLGGLADIAISDNFFLQPGLYFVSNGYHRNFPGGKDEVGLNTLELPVNIEYKIGMLGTNRFFVGAGPYASLYTGGYYKVFSPLYVDSKSDLRIGGGATDQIRGFDLGLGANVGYQLTAGLFFRARVQAGLLNLAAPINNNDNFVRSFNFCFSAGYIFYRRDKEGRLIIKRKEREADRKNKKYAEEHRTKK